MRPDVSHPIASVAPASDEAEGAGDDIRSRDASLERYKKMYDRSSALARIGVWECDLATDTLTWTDGVYDLFELPRGSALDRACVVLLYDEKSRREMEAMRSGAIASGGSFSLDVRIRTAKENERWIRLTADVETENGRSVRIFGTKQDITREKAAQEEVQALQAELLHLARATAMGAMASTLAHELNQPLTAIANYVAGTRSMLANTPIPSEAVEEGLSAIQGCVFRASGIIRSLRALPNEAAKLRKRLNPNALIREAASIAVSGAKTGLVLNMHLRDDIEISADPVQIQQVVINLVRNAAEAVECGSPREVIVSTDIVAGALRLEVEDTGPGIPRDILNTIFDAFVSTKPAGAGLGLAISRTIVESHGGRISASNRPSGGASICVILPLSAEETDAHVSPEGTALRQREASCRGEQGDGRR